MQQFTQLLEPLTEREQVVLRLLATGLSNRQIGEQLSLTLHTVKWYVKQIFAKLDVRRRTEAVAVAQSMGLLNSAGVVPSADHNLPVAVTPFVGREAELTTLAMLLNRPTTRVVTITGLGGIGKSRLALEAAARYHQTQAIETYFVPLAGAHSADALAKSIAAAINFQFSSSLNLERQLLAGLRHRSLLLLLDSVEHLLDSAYLVSRIVEASPAIKVLVTSRECLQLRGETIFAIQGLDYKPEPCEQGSAEQMFMQTAARLQPTFRPGDHERAIIGHICRLVEGMPLAIELAASWMDVLPPDRILAEMEDSLSFLGRQIRNVPDRHLSIRAVFAHSWDRLSPEEQSTLKRLSVFEGGFNQAAAEQVAGATIFSLSRLVNKSLVTRVGPDCYKLHDLLRQFAVERPATNKR
ncbi:MAG: hypothetical protein KDI79_17425 [Anaerolineae bacterium]|nr:hypothetical protein [Anaerolineae bacterium]